MNPLLFLAASLDAERDANQRRAEAWRRLHQRPDAAPLPPEPIRVGPVARIATWIATRGWPRRVTGGREERTAS